MTMFRFPGQPVGCWRLLCLFVGPFPRPREARRVETGVSARLGRSNHVMRITNFNRASGRRRAPARREVVASNILQTAASCQTRRAPPLASASSHSGGHSAVAGGGTLSRRRRHRIRSPYSNSQFLLSVRPRLNPAPPERRDQHVARERWNRLEGKGAPSEALGLIGP